MQRRGTTAGSASARALTGQDGSWWVSNTGRCDRLPGAVVFPARRVRLPRLNACFVRHEWPGALWSVRRGRSGSRTSPRTARRHRAAPQVRIERTNGGLACSASAQAARVGPQRSVVRGRGPAAELSRRRWTARRSSNGHRRGTRGGPRPACRTDPRGDRRRSATSSTTYCCVSCAVTTLYRRTASGGDGRPGVTPAPLPRGGGLAGLVPTRNQQHLRAGRGGVRRAPRDRFGSVRRKEPDVHV